MGHLNVEMHFKSHQEGTVFLLRTFSDSLPFPLLSSGTLTSSDRNLNTLPTAFSHQTPEASESKVCLSFQAITKDKAWLTGDRRKQENRKACWPCLPQQAPGQPSQAAGSTPAFPSCGLRGVVFTHSQPQSLSTHPQASSHHLSSLNVCIFQVGLMV